MQRAAALTRAAYVQTRCAYQCAPRYSIGFSDVEHRDKQQHKRTKQCDTVQNAKREKRARAHARELGFNVASKCPDSEPLIEDPC
eukprot:3243958-Amphidinium_carterae.1